jgi:hypothetical protein
MDDDEHDSGRVDFSALGPPIAAHRLDALVAATVHRGAGELARRAQDGAVIRMVVAWRRPLIAVSGLAAAAAIVLLARPVHVAPNAAIASAQGSARTAAPAGSIAEALGIPAGYAEAVEGSTRGKAEP